MHGSIAGCGIYILGGKSEPRRKVGDHVQAEHHHHNAYNQTLDNIAFGVREHQREEIEHTRKRCQRKELVAGEKHGKYKRQGNQQQRHHQCSGMADDKRRAHTDVEALGALEFTRDKAACAVL